MKSVSHMSSAVDAAREIESLDYVAGVRILPDVHFKPGMEAPSSIVVGSRGRIVPQLVSESINDGMGVVRTDLSVDDLGPDRLDAFLTAMNREGAKTKYHETRYSWSPELLEEICCTGAGPVLEHYGLPSSFVDAIEDRGRALGSPFTAAQYRDLVPAPLRTTRLTRREIGLNFGGNHFLEVQVVDRVVDRDQAERWGIRPGQVMVMYHLGPGPLGSMLSNLHATREKPPLHRKAGYAVGRLLMHGGRGRARYDAFCRRSSWAAIETDSEEGRRLAAVLAVIKNYGYGYRMGTVKAIGDALDEVFGNDAAGFDLLVDMSHNILQPETIGGEELWVSRHNCCRPIEGFPGIVAGNHQVPSYLTVGPPGCGEELSGYDHGVGALLQEAERSEPLSPDPRGAEVRRVRMKRGSTDIESSEVLPLLDTRVIDETIGELSRQGRTRPVATVRPIGTLKHVV